MDAGGPAEKAGIQAGDLITSVDGHPTPSAGAVATVLETLSPGRAVDVVVVRPSHVQAHRTVTLAELP